MICNNTVNCNKYLSLFVHVLQVYEIKWYIMYETDADGWIIIQSQSEDTEADIHNFTQTWRNGDICMLLTYTGCLFYYQGASSAREESKWNRPCASSSGRSVEHC